MEFFPFLRAPTEVQLHILDYVIPPQIIPAYDPDFHTLLHTDHNLIDTVSEEYLLPLKLSCRQIYNLMKILRPITGLVLLEHGRSHLQCHVYGHVPTKPTLLFRFNLNKDTLRVLNMRLPDFRTADGQIAPLPVERLVTISVKMHDSCGMYDETWSTIQFNRRFNLSRLPKLKEFSLICQLSGFQWRIESFEREGPQIDPRRNMLTDKWGLARSGYHAQGARAYWEKRIPAHTGIRWQRRQDYHHPPLEPGDDVNGAYLDRFCDDGDLDDPDDIPLWMYESERLGDFIPYVGFHGHDRGQLSMGGNWAGFRYFEETGEV
ncbi:hypothetical protein FSARC_3756 [Fusarium sarcochroum]|uniref:F-box domain-containing protein n=1 Tax=Fusarium sarcochroum TaxID=1208366 RepID=A0A8H4U3D0_9HYPO|nr:hypothetical protein FSARC_3756 [Fusarium sarcochroum]